MYSFKTYTLAECEHFIFELTLGMQLTHRVALIFMLIFILCFLAAPLTLSVASLVSYPFNGLHNSLQQSNQVCFLVHSLHSVYLCSLDMISRGL